MNLLFTENAANSSRRRDTPRKEEELAGTTNVDVAVWSQIPPTDPECGINHATGRFW
jgi:hypothetical protein